MSKKDQLPTLTPAEYHVMLEALLVARTVAEDAIIAKYGEELADQPADCPLEKTRADIAELIDKCVAKTAVRLPFECADCRYLRLRVSILEGKLKRKGG
jgi:hypothetical protein